MNRCFNVQRAKGIRRVSFPMFKHRERPNGIRLKREHL